MWGEVGRRRGGGEEERTRGRGGGGEDRGDYGDIGILHESCTHYHEWDLHTLLQHSAASPTTVREGVVVECSPTTGLYTVQVYSPDGALPEQGATTHIQSNLPISSLHPLVPYLSPLNYPFPTPPPQQPVLPKQLFVSHCVGRGAACNGLYVFKRHTTQPHPNHPNRTRKFPVYQNLLTKAIVFFAAGGWRMNDRDDSSGWLYYFEIDFAEPPEGEWTAVVVNAASVSSAAPLNNRVSFGHRLFEFWQREGGNSRRLNANASICFLTRGNFAIPASKKKVLHQGDLVVLDSRTKRGGGDLPISRHRVGEVLEIRRGEDRDRPRRGGFGLGGTSGKEGGSFWTRSVSWTSARTSGAPFPCFLDDRERVGVLVSANEWEGRGLRSRERVGVLVSANEWEGRGLRCRERVFRVSANEWEGRVFRVSANEWEGRFF